MVLDLADPSHVLPLLNLGLIVALAYRRPPHAEPPAPAGRPPPAAEWPDPFADTVLLLERPEGR